MADAHIPGHIAIIMDGNRRWARAQGLPVLAGHRKVADEVLEPLVEHAAKRRVKYLTFWAFSTENWKRSSFEVRGIMAIFRRSLKTFGEKMHRKGIRIRAIGDLSRFSGDIQGEVKRLMKLTKDNKRITVVFALNYGGRDELLRAMRKLAKEISNFKFQISNLTEQNFAQLLDTAGIPDPDLIVRPGGEKRLSGFLPWQSIYSEFYFADWMMPEFTPEKLDEILEDFLRRKRRFGK